VATSNGEALLPKISLKERDRRYRLVRKAMAAEGIDVLLVPANHSRWEQMMADSRYLTSIGGFGTEVLTVFPKSGKVTAYVFNRAGWWLGVQDWVTDLRDGRNYWADNAIETLSELKFRKGRIGIVGLAGLIRAPDGLIPYTTVERIKEAFPEAEIVNATALVQSVRSVKSAEELALMRRSMTIIERMIETMKASARVGVTEKHVYAAMINTLLENEGEMPSMFIFGTGPDLGHGSFVPTERAIRQGDLMVNEIEARYAGYSAQGVNPLVFGKPRKAYADLVEISRLCFDRIAEKMRPGTPLGALMDVYTRTVEREGKGKLAWGHPMMHARGLGDESPALLGNDDLERFRRVKLQAGMTFILKPAVRRGKQSARIGDTVVVTRNGGERLGKRPMELGIID
jgi:Xaa-Pro aminopeptidase